MQKAIRDPIAQRVRKPIPPQSASLWTLCRWDIIKVHSITYSCGTESAGMPRRVERALCRQQPRMEDEEDDVFEPDLHCWHNTFRQIKCEDRATQTPGPALAPTKACFRVEWQRSPDHYFTATRVFDCTSRHILNLVKIRKQVDHFKWERCRMVESSSQAASGSAQHGGLHRPQTAAHRRPVPPGSHTTVSPKPKESGPSVVAAGCSSAQSPVRPRWTSCGGAEPICVAMELDISGLFMVITA
ncbi:hypothetical protein WMY93_017585 [Mugilogobius chulae]|uniref:Uncharacterized protein n=1 Tax=Mugilogobius chulae TaxID=88201 RepID=A0AAW0NPW2_9GOBI